MKIAGLHKPDRSCEHCQDLLKRMRHSAPKKPAPIIPAHIQRQRTRIDLATIVQLAGIRGIYEPTFLAGSLSGMSVRNRP